ncbi:hypothetical protein Tco_1436398 [Tanacetum coccineum]
MQGFFSWFLGFTSILGDLLYFLDQLRTPLIMRNEFERCEIKGADLGGLGGECLRLGCYNFAGLEVSIGEGTTSKETNTSQDYIVMHMRKDSSLFDSLSMNVSHDEPGPSCDAKKKDDKGVSKASGVDDQERPESSTPNINTAGPSINTASLNHKTGSLHINTVSQTILTNRLNRPQSVSNIISLRDNVTLETTNADLFGDETEIDVSNLNASYHVPTTLITRIHKNHSLDHEEPKRVTKALSDSGWVEAMQEELL